MRGRNVLAFLPLEISDFSRQISTQHQDALYCIFVYNLLIRSFVLRERVTRKLGSQEQGLICYNYTGVEYRDERDTWYQGCEKSAGWTNSLVDGGGGGCGSSGGSSSMCGGLAGLSPGVVA